MIFIDPSKFCNQSSVNLSTLISDIKMKRLGAVTLEELLAIVAEGALWPQEHWPTLDNEQ
jgi:hypothetical protein